MQDEVGDIALLRVAFPGFGGACGAPSSAGMYLKSSPYSMNGLGLSMAGMDSMHHGMGYPPPSEYLYGKFGSSSLGFGAHGKRRVRGTKVTLTHAHVSKFERRVRVCVLNSLFRPLASIKGR